MGKIWGVRRQHGECGCKGVDGLECSPQPQVVVA